MNPFWSYFECKEAIAAPENVARIDLPMTKAFKRCKWLPLPSAFAARMRRFVAADKKLQDDPKYNDLARLAMCELQGIKLDLIDLARWAEKYLGVHVGKMPHYDKAAQERYAEERRARHNGRVMPLSYKYRDKPNREYFAWKERRDSANRTATPKLAEMMEYILRNVVSPEDLTVDHRNIILKHFVGELYKSYWQEIAGSSCSKEIRCSLDQWRESASIRMEEYLREGAEIQRKICVFSRYDLDALANLVGNEMPQMLYLHEIGAVAKIDNQLQTAIEELKALNGAIEKASKLGAMRENSYERTFNILKYRISVHITDVGKGVVLSQKAKDMACNAAGIGIAAAAVGAVVAFPPLLGLGALSLAIFGGSKR